MQQLTSKQRAWAREVCRPCTPCVRLPHRVALQRTRAGKQDDTGSTADTGVGLKAVWYAAEAFGKVIGGNKAEASASAKPAAPVMSRDQILAAIREDYSQNYFVSGLGDMAAYDDNCVFADPFVSFKGTQRFKQNVSNLGGLMRDINLDVYEFKEEGQDTLQTKWRFSCVLDLPWRPLLAAAGGTTHVIDLQSGRVVKHIEQWDVEPDKVVQQLFRPASKVPSNAWETFFMSASAGDATGMWLASTPSPSGSLHQWWSCQSSVRSSQVRGCLGLPWARWRVSAGCY